MVVIDNICYFQMSKCSGRLGPGSACAENAIFAAVTITSVESSQVGIFRWF